MPHKTSWYLRDHIIFVRMWDNVYSNELWVWNEEIRNLLNNSPSSTIHIIVDDSHLKRVFANMNQLIGLLSVIKHPKIGWTVNIGPRNPLFHFLGTLLTRLSNVRNQRVDTLEQAIEIVVRDYPALAEGLSVAAKR